MNMNATGKNRECGVRPVGLLLIGLGVLLAAVAPGAPAAEGPPPSTAPAPSTASAPSTAPTTTVPTEGQNLPDYTLEELDDLLEAAMKKKTLKQRPTADAGKLGPASRPAATPRSVTSHPVRRLPTSRPVAVKLPTSRPDRTVRTQRTTTARPPKPAISSRPVARPATRSYADRLAALRRTATAPARRPGGRTPVPLTQDQIRGKKPVPSSGVRAASSEAAAGDVALPVAGTQPVTVDAGGVGQIPGLLLPEKRSYQFSYVDTDITTVIEDVGRMSGLSILGLHKLPKTPLLNYISPSRMTYAEAMELLNVILTAEYDCFVKRDKHHLIVDKLSGFKKYITRIFPDRTTFEAAEIEPFEFVLVYHVPEAEDGAAADLMDNPRKKMPDYCLFGVIPSTNRMELAARASDVRKFFELLDLEIEFTKGRETEEDVRPFKAFEVVNMQAQEALKILQDLGVMETGSARRTTPAVSRTSVRQWALRGRQGDRRDRTGSVGSRRCGSDDQHDLSGLHSPGDADPRRDRRQPAWPHAGQHLLERTDRRTVRRRGSPHHPAPSCDRRGIGAIGTSPRTRQAAGRR